MQHPPKIAPKRGLRTRLRLLVVLACLVLAAAFVLLLPLIRARFPADRGVVSPRGSAVRTLYLGDEAQLDSITISQLGADSFTLRMRDGAAYLERDGQLLEADQELAAEIIEAVTQVVMQDTVAETADEVSEHLADMGLNPPQASAAARYHDGSEITLEIGYTVPNTSYAYCRWSGGDGVFMCDSGIADALYTSASRLLPVTQPTVASSLIDRLTLETPDSRMDIAFSAGADGLISTALTAPYHYPLEGSRASALLTALDSFRLGTREAVLTPDNRAAYGFDAPLCTVTLHQAAGYTTVVDDSGQLALDSRPEQTLTFCIGRAEGDYFYTCEYQGACYLVSRFIVETLTEAAPEKLVTRYPADLGDALIKDVQIDAPAGTFTVHATRTERVLPNNAIETDQNGQTVYDTAVTLNGEPIGEDVFDALTARLRALNVSGSLPPDWALPEGAQPRWRIVLVTEGGVRRVVEAYRMDAFADALYVDGTALHYAHSEAIDLALGDLAAQ
ncbi:MAG: DUF4340 domain-containing protein [Clostridiales bacterium]|nr:DUF4340 domain-containing protein [Clostridiales bacterium]